MGWTRRRWDRKDRDEEGIKRQNDKERAKPRPLLSREPKHFITEQDEVEKVRGYLEDGGVRIAIYLSKTMEKKKTNKKNLILGLVN